MNVTATLTSKGQITIPQAIREALGLDTGMRLRFELEGGELKVSQISSTTWNDLWHITDKAPKPKAPVDIDAALQATARQRMAR
jgi:AbrB family looped-hinge helix DNA binding protein